MKIRRFFGSNIRAALRQVTDEFGNDAAILSNKKVAGGVEVIAALDYDDSLMPPVSEKLKETPIETNESQSNDEVPARKESVASNKVWQQAKNAVNKEQSNHSALPSISGAAKIPDLKHTQSQLNQLSDQLLASKNSNSGSNNSSQIPGFLDSSLMSTSKRESLEWSLDPSLQAMKEELGLMRNMMSEQLKGIAWNRLVEGDPVTAMIIRRFAKLGLDNNLLNSLLPHIQRHKDAECAWQQVLGVLAKSIPVATDDLLEHGGVFALMGATGVGKTTTIAKLAARYVIKHGIDSVALITTDNHRISAQEQLSTFGRILQIPTSKLNPGQDLQALLKQYANKSLILIDTAGISSSDSQLAKPLESVASSHIPIKKLLLMSAASQAQVLRQSLRLFAPYDVDGIIMTKLDEAAALGEILSVVIKAELPVYYTTDGQRIPEDIRLARSHHLVAKAVWLSSQFEKHTDDWELAQSIEQVKSA